MKVDVSCRKCGGRARIDVGAPAAGQTRQEHVHLIEERLRHRPSFECFGGHMELRPALPDLWTLHWETLGEE